MDLRPRTLFLDDDESRLRLLQAMLPNADIVWVQSAGECIKQLDQFWDAVRLDHDLGGKTFVDSDDSETGMEVVRWICRTRPEHLRSAVFIIHTRNDRAGELMLETLRSAGYDASRSPFRGI